MNDRLSLNWDIKRSLAKINYKIHTDAVKEYLIPKKLHKNETNLVYANATQLLCLANLESLNAEFIRQGLRQSKRLRKLNEIAIIQMRSLLDHPTIKKLDK